MPIILLLIGIALAASALFYVGFRDTRVLETAFEMRSGSTLQRNFTVPYSGLYYVTLEMDQNEARRRFPCAVDIERFSDPSCADAGIPVALDYSLWTNGDVISRGVFKPVGAGGSYGGQQTFALTLVVAELRPGTPYSLRVVTIVDASALSSVRPRIVVKSDYTVGLGQMLYRLACGAAIATLGMLWAVGMILMRRRGKATAAHLGSRPPNP
jgi:hypothetical protein